MQNRFQSGRVRAAGEAGMRRGQAGLSIMELMISMTIGIFITGAVIAGFISSKTAFTRLEQISALQQNARTAFEYLTSDSRMAGHLGCFSGNDVTSSAFVNTLNSATTVPYAFAIGIEGYQATAASATVSNSPSYTTATTTWTGNTSTNAGATNTIPISTIHSAGLMPGSDVLVVRTTTGAPFRLTADSTATTVAIDSVSADKCVDGTTNRYSGFCANSIGVVATCSKAHVFQASGVTAAGAITHVASTSAGPGNATASWASNYLVTGGGNQYPEAFRLQTVIYYVAQGAQGAALFRKVYDGETTTPAGQELIENVESMQILYGRDTSTPADGIIDDYVTADAVTNWNAVVAVRIGLLLRSVSALAADAKTSTSVSVNGQAITVPASPKYDRRAFTTTIALRNRAKFIN